MDKEIDIEHAWKDEEYRKSLTPEQLAQLPPNPVGDEDISEKELDDVSGGNGPACFGSYHTRAQPAELTGYKTRSV